ncbi:NADH-quinone oxidoreductase subunit NuoF [Campylobacter fetus]|uniref:NADH-quinone oxidoreductase subunit NuoF n=1 Tax=Campylobacter fetus TaxID=196 RepID=UPI00073ABB1C|nr:NADH-quinone oxidoreductase subunit NuoF [Campylobacter fetus]ALV64154.1 NADH:quinone oxidoreductase I, chain F [Campylobacter fetus subsp. testudinum Sp3]
MQVVSSRFSIKDGYKIDVAKSNGAYLNLENILKMDRNLIVEAVDKSGLRGKGGGGGLCGTKWKNMLAWESDKRYLVVNGDESEPGTCKDKYILNLDPHLLIEGIIISSYALEAKRAYVYIRGEYEREFKTLTNAIKEAANELGDLEIIVYKGAGAYICGEKTALLESIEGKRGHPRLKPHNKAEPDFLFGHACVVNNVETIASVPFIVKNGWEAYRSVGTEKSPGTLLFAVSGCVNTPCVKEMPFGTKMIDFINDFGGGVWKNRELKAVIPGGSSAAVLTKDEVLKATLDYESLKEFKSALGTGGMMVFDDTISMPEVLLNLLEFYTEESCGQCTPCREGCGWALRVVKKIVEGEGSLRDLDTLKDISYMLDGKTICVFAPAVKDVIMGFITKFENEFVALCKETK